uniref:Uncharacterized protein n=1 Tax=Lactuca sativa TaxID=4236 RepID=A0A9R1UNA0_LACSA|nr:hypothetical protein LSAT_V11C800451790 [Lactuca sativa]
MGRPVLPCYDQSMIASKILVTISQFNGTTYAFVQLPPFPLALPSLKITGRNQHGNIAFQGTNTMGQGASSYYSGVAPPLAPPPPPPPPPSVMYPPYG